MQKYKQLFIRTGLMLFIIIPKVHAEFSPEQIEQRIDRIVSERSQRQPPPSDYLTRIGGTTGKSKKKPKTKNKYKSLYTVEGPKTTNLRSKRASKDPNKQIVNRGVELDKINYRINSVSWCQQWDKYSANGIFFIVDITIKNKEPKRRGIPLIQIVDKTETAYSHNPPVAYKNAPYKKCLNPGHENLDPSVQVRKEIVFDVPQKQGFSLRIHYDMAGGKYYDFK